MFSIAVDHMLALPRAAKRLFALAVDLCLVVVTVALSYYLRLDAWSRPTGNLFLPYVVSIALAIPLFIKLGLYRAIFRHAGFRMLLTITYACGVYGLLFATIFTLVGVTDVPRTIGILQPLLLLLAVIASRVSVRALLDWRSSYTLRDTMRRPVLIFGAGAQGRQLAAAARTSSDMSVVAFVDEDRTLHGGVINGLSIYPFDKLRALVEANGIEEILLALPEMSRRDRQQLTTRILSQIAGLHVSIRTLPTLLDLAQGKVTVSDLREVDVDDLLGRDPIPPNQLLLARTIFDKCVAITGAGGSIGRELCLQILAQKPSRMLLIEVSEYNLYSIHRTLAEMLTENGGRTELVPLLGNVQDAPQINEIVRRWRPDTVYHAAAYKHVPLVESNVARGIENNVVGTLNMARAAIAHQVRDFVLISTDKAVRPTNAMGTTKRLAEQVLQALSAEGGTTCFSMVRFGNVLGSSGSVVPLFREQIRQGGPVTLTHAEVTRYFMTIPEAAQLVIQAGAMAQGGEVFVLDMGEPMKIADLARLMIELSGLTVCDSDHPDGDIEIREVGMRPGEKLYEELLIGNDPRPTKHPRIMQASETFMPWSKLENELGHLAEAAASRANNQELIAMLRRLVPEYQPDEAETSPAHPEGRKDSGFDGNRLTAASRLSTP